MEVMELRWRDEVDAGLRAAETLLSPEGWAFASSLPVDPEDPGRYHALFGRDSLIFALQMLEARPDIASATLRALARMQGTTDDPEIEEEPGRIVHEFRPTAPARLVDEGWPIRDGGVRYYGTSDATSWFLIVLDATADAILQEELSEHTAAAARWLEAKLRQGGGLIRCGPRRFSGGLAQQGWRDCLDPSLNRSGGGIVRIDGSTPSPPLADADSQAVAVAALAALARLDPARRSYWINEQTMMRTRISSLFAPDVMAIDGEGGIVPGSGSQLGWLLWADALDESGKRAAVERLARPDVLTGFGVRTLSSLHPTFAPTHYHRGSIWPFDSWIAWGGLRGAGGEEAAATVREGILRARQMLGGYPELYAVDRDGHPYKLPNANRIQAWTVGAVVALGSNWDGRGYSTERST